LIGVGTVRIELIAFDSMGVRSMSTLVSTRDVRIHIDPAVSLAPRRYGLPPHPREIDRLVKAGREIEERAGKADVIIITHYHYDHHDPGFLVPLDIYRDKVVYVKDPENNINTSQRIRAARFLKSIEPLAREIHVAEGSEVRIGDTVIKISNAVPHGPSSRLGYVVEVSIKRGRDSFLYTSDVEGPCLEEHVGFILSEKPKILVVDGPLSYMLGYRYSVKSLQASMEYLKKIIDAGVKKIIVDHHFLRDLKYSERIAEVREYASSKGALVTTAAEYMGKPVEQLEALRDKLYEEEPVKEASIPENLRELLEE